MSDIGAITETAGAVALEVAVAAVTEQGGKAGPCTNCKTPLVGPYCAECGQPVDTHRRSVVELGRDFVSDIASFDSRILRTAAALMFRPGELPAAFREGRTQRYVPPVRLYLFVSLIFFVALSVFGIAILQLRLTETTEQYFSDKNHNVYILHNGVRERVKAFKADDKGNIYLADPALARKPVPKAKADGSINYTVSTIPYFFAAMGSLKGISAAENKVVAKELTRVEEAKDEKDGPGKWVSQHVGRMLKALAVDPASINEPLTEWIPRALIVLLPLFALLLAGFYWRQRKTYYFVDHLVFSLNLHTFGFLLLLIAAGLAQFLAGPVVALILFAWLGLYLLLAMKRFYGQNWFWTSAKCATVAFIYMAVFILPAFALIILASLIHI